jgi:hypothetical protein
MVAAAGCGGDRRAGALLGVGIGLANDGCCCWCSGDRRADALLVGGIDFWAMVPLQDAVVIAALVTSLVVASAWRTMVAAGCSSDRRASALLGGGIGLVRDGCCCGMQ